PPPLDADARVEAVGNRWRVELRTTRGGIEGYQTLEDESCDLLARATALVLALALYEPGDAAPVATPVPDEPRVEPAPRRRPPPALEPAKPAPEPPQEAEPAPPPPRPAALAPAPPIVVASPAPPSRARWAWALAAEARASRGPLPETNLGLSLGVDARRGRWLGKLRLVGGPPTEQASASAPDVTGRYQAWGASVAACVVARPDSRV